MSTPWKSISLPPSFDSFQVGVKQAVHLALCEPSIAVREATLDLIGQFVLSRPECVPLYYEPIVKRLADVGISVRQRL